MPAFEALAIDLSTVFTSDANTAGFRIPEYQRTYDWDEANILRYFEDLITGVLELNNDRDARTFLGTLILVEGRRHNDEQFDGKTYDIVDGQQRLTTTALTALLLHKTLSELANSAAGTTIEISTWLGEEVNYAKQRLQNCVFGLISPDGVENFPFPRLVRDNDARGPSSHQADYQSLIGTYLYKFARHITSRATGDFDFNRAGFDDGTSERLLNNVDLLHGYIGQLINGIPDESGLDFDPLDLQRIKSANYRSQFFKLPERPDEADRLINCSVDSHGDTLKPLLLLLCFTSYFLDRVLFTRVIAPAERYAFDIFDALNTTGEPLTAIETFKPRVVEFENRVQGSAYAGSSSEDHINSIEGYIDTFSKNSDRQSEAKNLVVSFALYQTGLKLGLNLNAQRGYLRRTFGSIEGDVARRKYIENLGRVSGYRQKFWSEHNISAELIHAPERELSLLLIAFITSLKTTLSIPILARYYYESEESGDWASFTSALKALTAFIVIWRSVTGTTGGIDTALRGLMSRGNKPAASSNGLHIGLNSDRDILTIDQLKDALRSWLEARPVEVNDRATWISKAKVVPLYKHSTGLCRFILLAAIHHTVQDTADPSRLRKDRPGPSNNFLNYNYWKSESVESVEHVAPQNDRNNHWERSIYDQPYLVHSVGNLTLLPIGENSAVGNKSWRVKHAFFEAFSANTLQDVTNAVATAKAAGINFGSAESRLSEMHQLPIIKSVASQAVWNADTIRSRTEELLGLAWDEIESWLY